VQFILRLILSNNNISHLIFNQTKFVSNKMARNPSALIWITHKASKVQRKHKNMKWKSAIKEAAAQYHKKHGTKKVVKKNLEKEKGAHKYNTCKIYLAHFQSNILN